MNGVKSNELNSTQVTLRKNRPSGDECKKERSCATADRFYELLALVTWVFLLLVYLNGIHKITFGLILFAPLLVVQSAILLHLVEMFAT